MKASSAFGAVAGGTSQVVSACGTVCERPIRKIDSPGAALADAVNGWQSNREACGTELQSRRPSERKSAAYLEGVRGEECKDRACSHEHRDNEQVGSARVMFK